MKNIDCLCTEYELDIGRIYVAYAQDNRIFTFSKQDFDETRFLKAYIQILIMPSIHSLLKDHTQVKVCVCVSVCVCACVRACVCVCVHMKVYFKGSIYL